MSKRFIAGVTLVSFLSIPAAAIKGDEVGFVASEGKVLTKSSQGVWEDASSSELQVGDQVRTGLDGEVVINLPNKSKVRLAPQTQIKIVDLDDNAGIVLERGRIVSQANGAVAIHTDKTVTKATKGSFVVATSADGTGLDVISGNATLAASEGDVQYALPGGDTADQDLVGGDNLNAKQYYGDIALLDDQWKGKWKGKGGGARSDDDDEAVGGAQQTSPDVDVTRPVRRPTPPPTPPTTPPPPPVTTAPPTTPPPPVTTTPPATPPPTASTGGLSTAAKVGIGVAAAGAVAGVIALVDDDDDDPSPSFP